MDNKYYDPTKLLSLKDINGKIPELYICTTNRTAGKTVAFNHLAVNRFLKNKQKFCLLYRYKYELDSAADNFFKDINAIFYPKLEMTSKRRNDGIFYELLLMGAPCGYAISINSAEQIKKCSHLLSDTSCIIFDEFQSESGKYCKDEVKKFLSIHGSLSRGVGKQKRYLPVYMIGNPITLLNPYYTELDISARLSSSTKYMRGDGWVLEQGYNSSAAHAQETSGINAAFDNTPYIGYQKMGVYLNDKQTFIQKLSGKNNYLATIHYDGKNYSIKEYPNLGLLYCDTSYDGTNTRKISVTNSDHDTNFILLQKNHLFIQQIKYYFIQGCFRFKNLKAKEAIIKLIS